MKNCIQPKCHQKGHGKLAVITGADGGMGMEITRYVALAGFRVIMICHHRNEAEKARQILIEETGNTAIEVLEADFSSLKSVAQAAEQLLTRQECITLLMNNAGTLETGRHLTEDGLERTVSVNYVAPYLLTRKLLPCMEKGSRIVNMVSCTYAIGHLDFPDFFTQGKKGRFWRIPVYSNTKLALTLFTFDLAHRLQERGIRVNAADPGIVSTNMITMHQWFDPLTDIFFRPFIVLPAREQLLPSTCCWMLKLILVQVPFKPVVILVRYLIGMRSIAKQRNFGIIQKQS